MMRDLSRVFILVAGMLLVPALLAAPVAADAMTWEDSIDRDGSDYSSLFPGNPGYDGTPDSCSAYCLSQPACNAATWAAHDRSCWLKKTVPVATQRSGVISFVRVISEPTTSTVPTSEKTAPGGSGGISVISDPPGASVYLDGEFKGVAPLNLNDLTPTTHNLLVTLKGYDDKVQKVTVTAGSVQPVNIAFGGKKTPGFGAILAVIGCLGFLMVRKIQ